MMEVLGIASKTSLRPLHVADQHKVALVGPQGGKEIQIAPQLAPGMGSGEVNVVSLQGYVVFGIEYSKFHVAKIDIILQKTLKTGIFCHVEFAYHKIFSNFASEKKDCSS